ncbi:MAG: winged helix-turn-helix transcriptional regulator [Myxococcaceae bacterium]|nr:winged helix-turn-helix transcriptional regulator [Myxococcaceae bacterium]
MLEDTRQAPAALHTSSTSSPSGSPDLKAVFNALRRLVRAARRSANELNATLGISGSQLFVLQQLVEHPKVSLGELAALTHTDHSSVSVVVSRLVRRRLVARRPSSHDGRRVELSLTPKGRALLHRAPEVLQERLVAALEGLPKGKLRTLRVLLDRVVSDAGLLPEPAEMFHEPIR